MVKLSSIILLMSITLVACNTSTHNRVEPTKSIPHIKQKLTGINYELTEKDKALIKDYISRHKLTMKETPSGLFIYVYGNGSGLPPKNGDRVTYYYRVTLLDGTECYKSEPTKPESFIVGHGGVERGLEEGITFMRKGQKALFILPPHLAHGLIGDLDKIPPRSSVVYEIELIGVEH